MQKWNVMGNRSYLGFPRVLVPEKFCEIQLKQQHVSS